MFSHLNEYSRKLNPHAVLPSCSQHLICSKIGINYRRKIAAKFDLVINLLVLNLGCCLLRIQNTWMKVKPNDALPVSVICTGSLGQ